jgi:hypothetical protein
MKRPTQRARVSSRARLAHRLDGRREVDRIVIFHAAVARGRLARLARVSRVARSWAPARTTDSTDE